MALVPANHADRSAWRTVRTLDPGNTVVMTTAETRVVMGSFRSADASGISISKDGVVQRMGVEDVRTVERRAPPAT